MPGMENLAPERTETRSGLAGSPKPLPERASTSSTASRTSSQRPCGQLLAGREVVVAGFGRDGEAGWRGQAGVGHLGEPRALAAEEVLHGAVALGAAVSPGVDVALGGVLGRVGADMGRETSGCGLSGMGGRSVRMWTLDGTPPGAADRPGHRGPSRWGSPCGRRCRSSARRARRPRWAAWPRTLAAMTDDAHDPRTIAPEAEQYNATLVRREDDRTSTWPRSGSAPMARPPTSSPGST